MVELFNIKPTITYTGAAAAPKKALRAAVKKGMDAVGHFWHKRILPDHFTVEGARRYGYKKRTKNYQKKKARTHHHQKPLVWSGELRKQALSVAFVRASSRKASVRMPFLRALNFASRAQRQGDNYPDIRKELTATHSLDLSRLARELDKTMQHHLRTYRGRKVTKI